MIEFGLKWVIFGYCLSFGFLIVDYSFIEVYNLSLIGPNGEAMGIERLKDNLDIDRLSEIQTSFQDTDSSLFGLDALAATGEMLTFMFKILVGAYFLDILHMLGLPPLFVTAVTAIYGFFAIRSIIAYIRGT